MKRRKDQATCLCQNCCYEWPQRAKIDMLEDVQNDLQLRRRRGQHEGLDQYTKEAREPGLPPMFQNQNMLDLYIGDRQHCPCGERWLAVKAG
jgi:hypothetical protein